MRSDIATLQCCSFALEGYLADRVYFRVLNEKMKGNKQLNEHDAVEIKNWLKKIIDNCENTFHFEGAQILIDKFKEICKKKSDIVDVQDYFNGKYNEVHGVIR